VCINFSLTTTFITNKVNIFLFAMFIDDSLEIEDDAKSDNHAVSPGGDSEDVKDESKVHCFD